MLPFRRRLKPGHFQYGTERAGKGKIYWLGTVAPSPWHVPSRQGPIFALIREGAVDMAGGPSDLGWVKRSSCTENFDITVTACHDERVGWHSSFSGVTSPGSSLSIHSATRDLQRPWRNNAHCKTLLIPYPTQGYMSTLSHTPRCLLRERSRGRE